MAHYNEADRVDLLMLCSRGGKEAYAARINQECPNLLDLLQSHPSCKPGWAQLLDALQPLQPRLYSITTAPEVRRAPAHAHDEHSFIRST